jgi:hypothetical protein
LLACNHGLHCLALDGTELWLNPLREPQHVVAGKFRSDSEFQIVVAELGFPRTVEGSPACVYLFDAATGQEIWRRTQKGWQASARDIHWTAGHGCMDIMVFGGGRPATIYDGNGAVMDELEVPPSICGVYNNYPGIYSCHRADVYGDSREEVVVSGWKGVRVHANARPLAIPTLYNSTRYFGM